MRIKTLNHMLLKSPSLILAFYCSLDFWNKCALVVNLVSLSRCVNLVKLSKWDGSGRYDCSILLFRLFTYICNSGIL